MPKLLRYIKAGFADRTSDDRLLALQLVDLLVLDDLGTEYHRDTYDYNDQALFELLNERDQYDRSTIITSNSPRADLEPRIRSRIAIQTRELHLDAPDYRGMSSVDLATEAALQRIWTQIENDPDVRVVVLTGAGDMFSAGQDLRFTRSADAQAIDAYGRIDVVIANALVVDWTGIYKAPCVDAPSLDQFARAHYAKTIENLCSPGQVF